MEDSSFDRLMTVLGIGEPPDLWRESAALAEEMDCSYFTESFADISIQHALEILHLRDEPAKALREALNMIRSNKELRDLARLCHYTAFHRPEIHESLTGGWPIPESMGSHKDMFLLVVLLTGLEHTLELHQAHGVPVRVTEDTLSDVAIWLDDYHSKHGGWGIREFTWLLIHFRGKLFRLGRLQFRPAVFNTPLRAFRMVNSNEVKVFFETGVVMNGEDQIDGTNNIQASDGRWETSLEVMDGAIRANPISRKAVVSREPINIPVAMWQPALSPGDLILEIHIATGSKMDYDACGDSLRQALDFFPKHFPECKFVAFTCISWLLDPQLEIILPADSNIVKCLREFHLFPVSFGDSQTLERIFGSSEIDIKTAPRDTSLRRAVIDFVSTGNRMRMAGGFILRDGFTWPKTATKIHDTSADLGVTIPMPIQIVIDDVGWWQSADASQNNGPYRTGISRLHVPEDYTAIAELGRLTGTRCQAAMILCEWDAENILHDWPTATWMGTAWDNSGADFAAMEKAAEIIRSEPQHFELTLHGIGHEYWEEGHMSRAEFHNASGIMRPRDECTRRLDAFARILDQHRLGPFPESFVPPAFSHRFGAGAGGLAAILAHYGVKYMSTPFSIMFRDREPEDCMFGVDEGILCIDRGPAIAPWDALAVEPFGEMPNPIVGLHWPNILHQDPARNLEVVARWAAFLQKLGANANRVLARNTREAFSQIIYHRGTSVSVSDGVITLDFRRLDAFNSPVSDEFCAKLSSHDQPILVSEDVEILSVEPAGADRLWIARLKRKRTDTHVACIRYNERPGPSPSH